MVLCMSLSADLILCTRTQLNEAKYIETHFEKESFAILSHLIPERPVFSNKTPYDDAIDSIVPSSLHTLKPKRCFFFSSTSHISSSTLSKRVLQLYCVTQRRSCPAREFGLYRCDSSIGQVCILYLAHRVLNHGYQSV